MRTDRAIGIVPLLLLACVAPAVAEETEWRDKIDVHGFLSVGFLSSSDNNYLAESSDGTFDFSEMGLNVGAQLADDVRIGAQLFMRELGALGNYDVEVDWAFVDWTIRDSFGVRAGRIKLPYGLYNETADIDAVRTSVILPQSVYRSSARDFLVSLDGVAVYGNFSIGRGGSFEYQALLGRNQFAPDGSVAREFSDSGAFLVDDVKSERTTTLAAIWNTPVTGLRVGVTGTRYSDSHLDVTTDPGLVGAFGFPPQTRIEVPDFDVRVYSAEYTRGPFVVAAEQSDWEGAFVNPVFADTPHFGGHYLGVSYRVSRRFEIGSYYSEYFANLDDKDGSLVTPAHSGYQEDLALSLRVDLNRQWIVKVEYHDLHGTGLVLNQDNPGSTTEEWDLLAIKTSFAF